MPLARLLRRQIGFTDSSGGAGMLFKVEDFHQVDAASVALRESEQFVRLGRDAARRVWYPI